MIIKNNWKSSNENQTEENNSLIEFSGLWSSQATVIITKPSIIKNGPVKYTDPQRFVFVSIIKQI